MRDLTAQGYTFLFITHKIHEVMRIADRVTALRLGEYVGTQNISNVTPKDIAHMMIGRDMAGITREGAERNGPRTAGPLCGGPLCGGKQRPGRGERHHFPGVQRARSWALRAWRETGRRSWQRR